MELLQLCLTPNYCQFQYLIYEFPPNIGVPIGSPLESLVSEVFFKLFEDELFQSGSPLLTKIVYWYRYVDDVVCLWNGSLADLDSFLQFINSRYPTIQFTLEIGGKSINFLDLSISLVNDHHEFNIHRKNTCTDISIHATSYCPPSYRIANFNSLIHRLITIPLSPRAFREELETIEYIA